MSAHLPEPVRFLREYCANNKTELHLTVGEGYPSIQIIVDKCTVRFYEDMDDPFSEDETQKLMKMVTTVPAIIKTPNYQIGWMMKTVNFKVFENDDEQTLMNRWHEGLGNKFVHDAHECWQMIYSDLIQSTVMMYVINGSDVDLNYLIYYFNGLSELYDLLQVAASQKDPTKSNLFNFHVFDALWQLNASFDKKHVLSLATRQVSGTLKSVYNKGEQVPDHVIRLIKKINQHMPFEDINVDQVVFLQPYDENGFFAVRKDGHYYATDSKHPLCSLIGAIHE